MTPDAAEVGSPETAVRTTWPWWERAAFRFAFLYWLLYILPTAGSVSLLDLLPWGSEKLGNVVGWPMLRLAESTALYVFHLPDASAIWHPTGSGDTALNFVLCFCIAVLALSGSAVWTAVAEARHKRFEYTTLYAWLRLLVRFTLAVTLLEYGLIKVFPGQFSPPSIYVLRGTFGDSTPMHLLWTFMGASQPYTLFGGLAEVAAGLLLLFRRTSTLGAMAAAGVLLNVVVLNFCYDVPVKLYSSHLLAMALFLLLPDAAPLWRFFVRRQHATLTGVWVAVPERRPLRIAARVLQVLVLLLALVWMPIDAYRSTKPSWIPLALRGSWAVDKADGWQTPWKEIVLDYPKRWTAIAADGHKEWTDATYDDRTHTIVLAKKNTTLHWEKKPDGEVSLQGTQAGTPVSLLMHAETFELQTRGFHWVQEYPANHGKLD